jgi:hypothetical protein
MITFPVYLVCGKSAETPMLLRAESIPVSVPLFSSVESAGSFLVQTDFVEDSEIWRVENATALKRWLDRVAGHCECVPWDICNDSGVWRSSGAAEFGEFLDAVSRRAVSEQLASAN